MFNFNCSSKYTNSCYFFFFLLNVKLKLMFNNSVIRSSISITVFISIKTGSSHKGSFRAERIRNSGAQFCVCLDEP